MEAEQRQVELIELKEEDRTRTRADELLLPKGEAHALPCRRCRCSGRVAEGRDDGAVADYPRADGREVLDRQLRIDGSGNLVARNRGGGRGVLRAGDLRSHARKSTHERNECRARDPSGAHRVCLFE